MTTQELRSYAATKGIKVIGLNNEKLIEACNVPEIGTEVSFIKKKGTPPIVATLKSIFRCKKTNIFYARMKTSSKKEYIKQLIKISKNENTTPITDAE